jgi:hypothetical protein
MRKLIIAAVLFVLCISFASVAQEELSGKVDVTYLTSKIWRGFDYYADDHSGVGTTVDLDLYDSGFGVKLYYARAINGGFENEQDLAGTLYYGNSLMQGQSNQMDYTVGWTYYGYPDEPRSGGTNGEAADMQELFASFAWPNLLECGVIPSYTVLTMWPSEGDSQARSNSGWAHIFGIDYPWAVNCPMTNKERIINLSAKAVYNDGVAPGIVTGGTSGSVEHDWSHAVFGASTDFAFADNMKFTPGVYYQSSWEDSVNTEDEYWASMNLSYSF